MRPSDFSIIHLEDEFSFMYDLVYLFLMLYFAMLRNTFDFSILLNHY